MDLKMLLVTTLLENMPDCRAIYRFGTWGTDAERPESDIDLAFLSGIPTDSVRRWELAQQLASLAGRDVDLVDLLTASTVLRMQVMANGERLYCSDSDEVDRFEDAVFSAYARLNEERREILNDIRRRGTVYGK
jgi:uncharacterized protein